MSVHKSLHARVDELESTVSELKSDIIQLRESVTSFMNEFRISSSSVIPNSNLNSSDAITIQSKRYCTPRPTDSELPIIPTFNLFNRVPPNINPTGISLAPSFPIGLNSWNLNSNTTANLNAGGFGTASTSIPSVTTISTIHGHPSSFELDTTIPPPETIPFVPLTQPTEAQKAVFAPPEDPSPST